MNRLGLKIGCLVVAIVIWVQVAATSVIERSTALPLRVVGLSEGLTLDGSIIPGQVDVVLRASKLTLLAHDTFQRFVGEVRLNLADRIPGPAYSYELAESDVYTDQIVIGVSGRVRLHIDSLRTRTVPIETVTEGSLPADLAFVEPLRVAPDSVQVTGAARFFPDEPSVRTAPIALGKLSAKNGFTVPLISPHHDLRLAFAEVQAVVNLGAVEDRTLANVPVIPLIDSGLPEVGVSPPVADVMVRGVADSVRALTESRFSVTVPVGNRPEGVYDLPGQVDHPAWLTWVRLDPPIFQVIVGKPPVAGTGPEGAGPPESEEFGD